MVVSKYHRRLSANIFDTDIYRSINIPKKGQIYHFNVGIYASKNVCVKDIGSRASMVLQNYQNLIEMTSNMIYIVVLGVGLKCPRNIHLNTQVAVAGKRGQQWKQWFLPMVLLFHP